MKSGDRLSTPTNDEIKQSILGGDADKAKTLAEASLATGMAPLEALEPFVSAIRHAGDLFDQGEFFLPQLLLAAQAMQAAMNVLFPEDGGERNTLSKGKVVAGTIQGDIHEIGKNLVCALLSANGFDVIDLGADVHLDRFVAETQAQKPDFLVLSALLTTTMINQKKLIDLLTERGLREQVKVLVGGAPVTAAWAEEIGADGYAPDAARAVDVAVGLAEN
jgi:corrinoid protein of di/trimethylamine methyltransferase